MHFRQALFFFSQNSNRDALSVNPVFGYQVFFEGLLRLMNFSSGSHTQAHLGIRPASPARESTGVAPMHLLDSSASDTTVEAGIAPVSVASNAGPEAKTVELNNSEQFRLITLPGDVCWLNGGEATLLARPEYDRLFDATIGAGYKAIAIDGTTGVGISLMHGYWILRYLERLQQTESARTAAYPVVTFRLRIEQPDNTKNTDAFVRVNILTRHLEVMDIYQDDVHVDFCLIDGYKTRIESPQLEAYGDLIVVTASDNFAGKFHYGSDPGGYPPEYPYTQATLSSWTYAEAEALLQRGSLRDQELEIKHAYAVFGGCIRWVRHMLHSDPGRLMSVCGQDSREEQAVVYACTQLGLELPDSVFNRFIAGLGAARVGFANLHDRSLSSLFVHQHVLGPRRDIFMLPASALTRFVIADYLHRLDRASITVLQLAFGSAYGNFFELFVRRSLLYLPPVKLSVRWPTDKRGSQPQCGNKVIEATFPPSFNDTNRPGVMFFANYKNDIQIAADLAQEKRCSLHLISLNPTNILFDSILLHFIPNAKVAYLVQLSVAAEHSVGCICVV